MMEEEKGNENENENDQGIILEWLPLDMIDLLSGGERGDGREEKRERREDKEEEEEDLHYRTSFLSKFTPEILMFDYLFRIVFSRDSTVRNSEIFYIGYKNSAKFIIHHFSNISQPLDHLSFRDKQITKILFFSELLTNSCGLHNKSNRRLIQSIHSRFGILFFFPISISFKQFQSLSHLSPLFLSKHSK
jgi:hypothetical protein